jgi:hypothetical protein
MLICDDEFIDMLRERLEKGGTVLVKNTWTYSKSYMYCYSTREDYSCCEDFYDSADEAIEAILEMANDIEEIEFL